MTQPKNSVQRADGSRMYVWPPTGETFTSVTTILNTLNKPVLVGWAARQAGIYAVDNWETLAKHTKTQKIDLITNAHKVYTENASEIGNHVHAHVEAAILGTDAPDPIPEHMRFFQAWQLVRQPKFQYCEGTIYNRTEGYAGSFDFIAEIDGVTTLIDVKTGKNVYPEVALQLAAYANGEFMGVNDTEVEIPKIQAAGVLHLRMTGYKYMPVYIGDEVWQAFRYIKEAFRWQQYTSKKVFNYEPTEAF